MGCNMVTDTVLKNNGMRILIKELGLLESERFITLIIREPFDYTKWRESFVNQFEDMSAEELSHLAMATNVV